MAGEELLERESELRVLQTLVAQAAGGDGRVGLIEGPPGIGKTRLVAAARRLAAEAGTATGGNPLLVAELASALAAEGVTGQAEDIARVAEIGPEAVARAVRVRLMRLSDEARSLAQAASVLGDGALLEDAAAMSRLELPRAATAATALAEADLLRAHETITFVHPVVRAAVYASLGPFGRREGHERAVRLLTQAGRPADRIAAHVLRCPPAADPGAVGILRVAARRSMADGAAGLTAEYLLRALEEPPPRERRPEILFELGTAERLLDLSRAAGHLREALTLTQDPARRAQIALGLGRALYGTRQYDEAESVFEEALADPSLGAAQMRSLETGLVVLGLFEPQLVPLARERLRRFDPGAPLTDLDSRILLAYGSYDQARTGTSRDAVTKRALRLLGDRAILAEDSQGAYAAASGVLLAADRLDDAQRLAENVTRAGEESGSALLAANGLWLQASVLAPPRCAGRRRSLLFRRGRYRGRARFHHRVRLGRRAVRDRTYRARRRPGGMGGATPARARRAAAGHRPPLRSPARCRAHPGRVRPSTRGYRRTSRGRPPVGGDRRAGPGPGTVAPASGPGPPAARQAR